MLGPHMGTHACLLPLRFAALALALSIAQGCSLRPQPEPPASEARLDPTKLSAEPAVPAAIQPIPGLISGAPGAADPPGARVRVFNLDRADDPAEAWVRDDGSFDVELLIMEGEEVRLQVHDDSVRSVPVDLLVGDLGQPPTLAIRPLAACLLLAPALEDSLGEDAPSSPAETAILVSNRCDHDVALAAPRLRRNVDGLDLLGAEDWPTQLASGNDATVRIRYSAASAPFEEILLLEAVAPVRDRRPVTLRAGAVP